MRRALGKRAESAPDGNGARRMFTAVAVLVALAIAALNLHAPADPTPLQRLLASLLIALCAVPSLMWAARRPWRHSVMPYVGVLYAGFFAAPVFVRASFFGAWRSRPLVEAEAIDYALVIALVGWGALLAGHFAVVGRKWWPALPSVRLLPNDDPKFAKAVAVVVGLAAAPFYYLDKAAVAAYFVGETLLPDAIAFPVTLAGEFVLFAALVCFHLHLRGQLGVAGRLYLVALVAYYTALGFGTGMVNHGVKAVFALFVAYAVVSPRPTWRGIACGVAAAAAIIFVLMPARLEFRHLTWTHGAGPNMVLPLSIHQFVLADGEDGEEQALTTSAYDVTLRDRTVAVAHGDLEVCSRQPTLGFGILVDPVDPNDLPERWRRRGFEAVGTSFEGGVAEDGRCAASIRLPDYRIAAVRVRLYQSIDAVQREFGDEAPQSHLSLAEKTTVFAETVAAAFDREDGVKRSAALTPKRLDYLLPLAWIAMHTPDPLPFLHGETYLPILYKLVPRALFADKPADVRHIGVRYGFGPPAVKNNIKVHQLGEFYMNFGLAGVLFGMVLLGLLYRSLHGLFHQPGTCAATLAAGTHMLAVLASEMESVLSVSLGFLIWYAIALAFLALIVRGGWRLRR